MSQVVGREIIQCTHLHSIPLFCVITFLPWHLREFTSSQFYFKIRQRLSSHDTPGVLIRGRSLIKKIQYIVHLIINYRLVGTHSVVRTDLRLSHKLHPVPPSLKSDFFFQGKNATMWKTENEMEWKCLH